MKILKTLRLFLSLVFAEKEGIEKDYQQWVTQNEGKNFFFYNERKKALPYIEQTLVPCLEESIEIIYLENKQVQHRIDAFYLSTSMRKFKNYNKFPHLMKIRKGNRIDYSINNTFYNVLDNRLTKEKLLEEINLFFELK